MSDRLLPDLLDAIEQRELALLGWGITDGSFAEDELLDLIRRLQPTLDPDDLLDRLVDQGLVVELLRAGRYRTRMAETVRLAFHLRQWFHGHDWQTAKPLVSDLRFLSRSRSVPRRTINPDAVIAALETAPGLVVTAQLEAAVRTLLADRSVSGFQVRAAARVLERPGRGAPLATCVAAGTGAGKTLAFYLPALAHVLATPRPGAGPRAVALYPRTELLRDQLRSALTMVRALGDAGAELRIGALYHAVPKDRADATLQRGWRPVADGLECPILTCLCEGCAGAYVWRTEAGQEEVLTCASCGDVLRTLAFTRNHQFRTPPAVLFTSTEMVNRLLGTRQARRLLVGEPKAGPEFVLLDEIHTYAGTHGAQVANLLRRWRAEMGTHPHIVGLSATLADPAGFISQMTGVATSNVAVIEPRADELMAFGREYFLALRGDPASQTALLSTTIQTSMLLRRMLDRTPGKPSEGAFGTRLFVFTDKLDGANRLLEQLRDAEGWRHDGINRKPPGSLATLRRREEGQEQARDRSGQLWRAAQEIGTLGLPVKVSRTTSKDSGVEGESDIVVATASLEVGFDDPHVGAVLQHQAPRDAAQFLQRRGRAGRNPAMRPWTAVVLSDYGRDRLAFQGYEQLFDPVVPPSHLPIRNRVVLKMQAAWWLIDHLGRHTGSLHARRVIEQRWHRNEKAQVTNARRLLDALEDMLTERGVQQLSSQLRRALDIDEDEVRSVLWDHPRALVTSVIPTLIRRVQAILEVDATPADYVWSDPLDDFVPRTLFAPLQVPEVRLSLPFRSKNEPPEVESISLSMREFAPGRVNYRYALGGRRERLWVQPPPTAQREVAVESFCPDHISIDPPPGADVGLCVQPRAVALTVPPPEVPDSAFGSWVWQTSFRQMGSPLDLDLPARTGWSSLVRSMQALTHRGRCPVTVWRYATECEVEPRSATSPSYVRHQVTVDGHPGAIGFTIDADALLLVVQLPPTRRMLEGDGVLRALRTARLEHVVAVSPVITLHAPSPFLRAWLAHLLTTTVVRETGDGQIEDVLSGPTSALRAALVRVAEDLFDADPPGDPEGRGDVADDPALLLQLIDILGHDDVVDELRQLGHTLHAPSDLSWSSWIHERVATTIAAAVIDAVGATCPDLDINELRPDVEIENDGDDGAAVARIWLTEDAPGGTGTVEAAVDRYLADPRAFWALVSRAVGPCDAERVDGTLRTFLDERARGGFEEEVHSVRSASHLGHLTDAWSALRTAMFRRGLDSDQSVTAALSTRLLRSGSDERTEELVRDLLTRWDELESHLGVEVEVRALATVAATDPDLQRRVEELSGALAATPAARIGQVLGLLWSRGATARAASLQAYNPYRSQLPTERLLVEALVERPLTVVDHGPLDWRGTLDAALHRDGRALVRCTSEDAAASVARALLVAPTTIGVLELHPRVVGLTRERHHIEVEVEIREAHQ